MRRALLGAAAVLVLAACHDSVSVERVQTLDDAQARWQQVGIQNYTFVVRLNCFCANTAPVRVTVANGVPTSAVFADSTNVAADTATYHSYLTVDRIFAVIRSELQQNPAQFTADYDAATGYPKAVNIDPKAMIADDEIGIQVTALTPNP